ncbi:hypothetical protein JEM67_09820 [Serratia sp. PAMC26656]|uniref:hypothetical protein n=1 Tax=Serratia sp. PAMC26656 TaxID=2775909 RepID=UPI0018F3B351|nr:hypothetical protein [Serratia sp. PAMC26656]MBJ7889562.1 hypothetical protein [Serratia sp. PAMC26656]
MKERPVIFNGEMVRAILDGRKTQTRRVMKVQPKPSKTRPGDFWFSSKKLESMVHVSDFMPGNSPIADCHHFFQEHCCPFGQVGDRLWVRETFMDLTGTGIEATTGKFDGFAYRADTPAGSYGDEVRKEYGLKWTPSLHMPRKACRILLEITAVRVERLNDISEEDAKAEGYPVEREVDGGAHDPWLWFRDLWDGIYPDNDFKVNPWVWVIEFKRVGGSDASK